MNGSTSLNQVLGILQAYSTETHLIVSNLKEEVDNSKAGINIQLNDIEPALDLIQYDITEDLLFLTDSASEFNVIVIDHGR